MNFYIVDQRNGSAKNEFFLLSFLQYRFCLPPETEKPHRLLKQFMKSEKKL